MFVARAQDDDVERFMSSKPTKKRARSLLIVVAAAGVIAALGGCRGGSDHMIIGDLNLADAACGATFNAKLGNRIVVSLNSTYWNFDGSSDHAVLMQEGMTAYAPDHNCVPGGGCGTATAVFLAAGTGQAVINASRTSCGEAVGCGPGQGQGQCSITVTVGR